MAGRINVLIDLNIILDALQKREPHHVHSSQIMALAETQQIVGFVAAHSLATLFYLYAKFKSAEEARVQLTKLLQFLTVAAIDQKVIEQALQLPYRDYEDALQMMAVVHAKVDYVVTRNVKDFKTGPLTVVKPAELLTIIQK